MKPTTHSSRQKHEAGDGSFRSFGLRSFPQTDYHFQGDRLNGAAARDASAELRAFRNLSREFFRGETRRSFVREFLLFTVIGAVSAWPVATMVSALLKMLH
ncbi:MAG: hypothetical protein ABI839_01805 [Verrucomicrobiota bacterium]